MKNKTALIPDGKIEVRSHRVKTNKEEVSLKRAIRKNENELKKLILELERIINGLIILRSECEENNLIEEDIFSKLRDWATNRLTEIKVIRPPGVKDPVIELVFDKRFPLSVNLLRFGKTFPTAEAIIAPKKLAGNLISFSEISKQIQSLLPYPYPKFFCFAEIQTEKNQQPFDLQNLLVKELINAMRGVIFPDDSFQFLSFFGSFTKENSSAGMRLFLGNFEDTGAFLPSLLR